MNTTVETLCTKPCSLMHVLNEASDIQSLCEDYDVEGVNTRNFYYNAYSNGIQFTTPDGAKEVLSLTPFALQQLCSKMGVPSRYVEKCIENGMPDLAAENLNAWIDGYGKNLFVRSYDNTARGILSDRYTTLDAPDVLQVLGDKFDNQYKVRGVYLSPERLHLRLVQREMMNIKGEDLFAGVVIDSSDVGRSPLSVRFFIYKQVCTNGMCISEDFGTLFSQKHIGITQKEFSEGLSENLSRIPDMMTEIMSLIKQANSDADPLGWDRSLFEASHKELAHSRIKALTKLSDEGVEKVIETMYNNYTDNRWGFINSLTEVAQDYSLERRLELEQVASRFLTKGNLLAA